MSAPGCAGRAGPKPGAVRTVCCAPSKPSPASHARSPRLNRSRWRCVRTMRREVRASPPRARRKSSKFRSTIPGRATWGRHSCAQPARPRTVQWRFNAWGNNIPSLCRGCEASPRGSQRSVDLRVYNAPLVCEGGANHGDGEGTLIATEQTLLNTNRNPELTQQDVEESLALYAGARRIVWLGEGFSDDETDGHIDNIACFVAPGRVLVGVPSSKSHPDYEPVMEAIRRLSLCARCAGRALEIVELAQPLEQRTDARGRLLQASYYINFYPAPICARRGRCRPSTIRTTKRPRAVLADFFPRPRHPADRRARHRRRWRRHPLHHPAGTGMSALRHSTLPLREGRNLRHANFGEGSLLHPDPSPKNSSLRSSFSTLPQGEGG